MPFIARRIELFSPNLIETSVCAIVRLIEDPWQMSINFLFIFSLNTLVLYSFYLFFDIDDLSLEIVLSIRSSWRTVSEFYPSRFFNTDNSSRKTIFSRSNNIVLLNQCNFTHSQIYLRNRNESELRSYNVLLRTFSTDGEAPTVKLRLRWSVANSYSSSLNCVRSDDRSTTVS